MTGEAQPFTRVEPAPDAGEASVIVGWRQGDGTESVVLRLPLRSAIRALFDELKLVLTLLPTGVIALDADALPERDFGVLMADGGLPKAPLQALVHSMLDDVADTPDASDAADLERLAKDLERAARDVRDALTRLKAGG